MKSFIPGERDIQKQWHVVDADGKILGRLATRVARLLTGKDKPIYTPFLDTGDHVIVVNAAKVQLDRQEAHRQDVSPSYGLSRRVAGNVGRRPAGQDPGKLVREAVVGMLPKTKLGRAMRKKLKVYPGPQHPHQAQRPTPWPCSWIYLFE